MSRLDWITKRLEKEINNARSADPFEIAEHKNIIVRRLPLGNTYGFYMKYVRHQVITLNRDIPNHLMPFVCAHELGHAILHPDENTPFLRQNTLYSTAKIEREANEFATRLLLYDKSLEDYETRFDVLRENGIPYEMERFI